MRLCFLVLACVIAASAWPVKDISLRVHGENGWYVPQITGDLKWVTKYEGERQLEYYEAEESLEGRLSTNTVKFYLYTLKNPSTGQQITASKASIDASNFNPNNPTRFTIHGWNSNYKDGVNTKIADAWFQYGDYNMIAVDWSRGRSLEYATSVAGAAGAGKKVAALADFLVEQYGMSLDTLEVVGFSLGAHVAGFTAKNVNSGTVGKVVGLDPASPLLSYSKPEKRLASDDAKYVETIQTNGAVLGFTQPIGKAAFYMNGGRFQPGCGIDLTGSCSHTRAVLYYVEALLWNNFPAKRCETYQQANSDSCGDTYSSITMGALINAILADGIFYVPVHSASPYGYGEVKNGGEETTGAPEVTTAAPEVTTETTAASGGEETTETTAASGGEETTAAPEDGGDDETTPEDGGDDETTDAPENGGDDETTPGPEDGGDDDTTPAPEDETTTEPEESGEDTTPAPEDGDETTTEPEDSGEDTTPAPEDGGDDDTTPEDGGDEETTPAPEDETTTEPEESGEDTTSAAEDGDETTTEPEESGEDSTSAPEDGGDDDTTLDPEDGGDDETTPAPEDETTSEPEESGEDTTPAPEDGGDDDTTLDPEDGGDDETTAAPEDGTTPAPEDDNETTAEPEGSGEDTTTPFPEDTTTTEITTNTPIPDQPTTKPPTEDKPGSSKNVFIFNVFLINVKIEK
ncbi:hypothetical protein KR009_009363 [Drosophila setifemur]|nr:hypothetical protein KR009_009363 [Drosophila setifemur]